MNSRKKRYFDLSFIAVIILLFALLVINSELKLILSSLFLIFIGGAISFSKKLKDDSYVANFFYWLSCNAATTKFKNNHVIWGILIGIIGVLMIFFKKDNTNEYLNAPDQFVKGKESWFKDPILWIVLVIIIASAWYKSKHKKDRNVRKNE